MTGLWPLTQTDYSTDMFCEWWVQRNDRLDESYGVIFNAKPSWSFAQHGQVAQSVEQRTENPRVGGSIPPLATKHTDLRGAFTEPLLITSSRSLHTVLFVIYSFNTLLHLHS